MNTMIGKCPRCGDEVTDMGDKYSCRGTIKNCDFLIWKSELSPKNQEKQVKLLLTKGKTKAVKDIREGEKQKAILRLNENFDIVYDWIYPNKIKLVVIIMMFSVIVVAAGFLLFSPATSVIESAADETTLLIATIAIVPESTSAPLETSPTASTAAVTTTREAATTADSRSEERATESVSEITVTSSSRAAPNVSRTTNAPRQTATQAIQATQPPETIAPPTATSRVTAATTASTTRITTTSRVTAPPTVPVPSSIRASANGSGVELTWRTVDSADGYELSRSISMVGGYSRVNAIAVRDGSMITVNDNSVAAGVSYYYSVRAFRDVGGVRYWSEHSEIVSVTVR